MDRSRFLAGLIGPVLAAVSVSILINPGLVAEMSDAVQGDVALIVVAGVLALVAGLAIVMSHNVWRGWPAVVTVFGWAFILGGLLRILFPAWIARIAADLVLTHAPWSSAMAAVLLLLGLFLSLMAFRPRRTESVQ